MRTRVSGLARAGTMRMRSGMAVALALGLVVCPGVSAQQASDEPACALPFTFPDEALEARILLVGEAHGTHESFRHGGSIGAGTYPGRVIPGLRMAGRMGNERVTTLNLEVVRVDAKRNLLYLRGSVPGHRSALIQVRPTVA